VNHHAVFSAKQHNASTFGVVSLKRTFEGVPYIRELKLGSVGGFGLRVAIENGERWGLVIEIE